MKTKKALLLIHLILYVSVSLFSQSIDTNQGNVSYADRREPIFPGGDKALLKWLGENTNYPKEAEEKNIEGTVWVTFVIEKDGSVSNVQILKGANTYLDNEALRVTKLLPKWTPGWENGHFVRVYYRMPIKFSLKSSEPNEDIKRNSTQAKNTTTLQGILTLKGIKIGPQEWESENLSVITFRNGDTIPEAETAGAWKKASEAGKPAWCFYNMDTINGRKYGRLYNWYAVHDRRGLAPDGWHIPTDYEWNSLVTHLGGSEMAGSALKSYSGWINGSNNNQAKCYFLALPSGFRAHYDQSFGSIGHFCGFWLNAENDDTSAFSGTLSLNSSQASKSIMYKDCGLSCRCVKD